MSAGGSGRPRERGDVGRGIDPREWLVNRWQIVHEWMDLSGWNGIIQNKVRQADLEVASPTSIYSYQICPW